MRRHRSICFGVSLASILLVGGLAACGDDDDTSTTTTTNPSTTTTRAEASTTTTAATTTSEATTTTIGAVVAGIQAQLDELYAASPRSPNVTGPGQLVCTDSGPIEVGGVFACQVVPQTKPGFDLESGSMVFFVLDASGRAATTGPATDVPGSTEALMRSYEGVPKGLYCRDLLNDSSLYPFNDGYFWSLVYWSLEGEPDRMDADGNGIPCETLYEPEVIDRVLDGNIRT